MANDRLKLEIPNLLSGPELLTQQSTQSLGLSTGFLALDELTFSKGIPRGALSLFAGPPGFGATSLWLETVRQLKKQKGWALWISQETLLFAPPLKNRGLDFQRLYFIKAPKTLRDWHFMLREALEAGVFSLIGCEVTSLRFLRRTLPQIKNLAEKSQTAFVFFSADPQDLQQTQAFSWILEFKTDQLLIHKAKNRSSFTLPWRGTYAHLLSQFSQTGLTFDCGGLSEGDSSIAIPGARPSLWRHQPDAGPFQKLKALA